MGSKIVKLMETVERWLQERGRTEWGDANRYKVSVMKDEQVLEI